MRRFRIILFFGGILAVLPHADAQGLSDTQNPSPPAVLLIRFHDSGPVEKMETQLLTELKLLLDSTDVRSIALEKNAFLDKSLDVKIQQLTEAETVPDAVAAIWLENDLSGSLRLHVVSLDSRESLVLPIEVKNDKTEIAELALITHELIQRHGIILGISALESTPIEETPDKQQEVSVEVAASNPTRETPKGDAPAGPPVGVLDSLLANLVSPSRWSIGALLELGGGIAGSNVESFRVGGVLLTEWYPSKPLFFRYVLGVSGGPYGREDGIALKGRGFRTGLEAGYLWDHAPFSLGPTMSLGALWTRATIPGSHFSWWVFRLVIGADLRWQATDLLCFVVNLSTGWHMPRFKRFLNIWGQYTAPFWELQGTLGVVFSLDGIDYFRKKLQLKQRSR